MEKIKSATDECIPSPKRVIQTGKKYPIPRWNEEVNPFKDDAYFWHSIWQSAGRPLNTELHRIMKKTRNLYHFQIRKNRKMTDIIKKNTLLDACVNNNGDIFNEIINLRRSVPTVPSMIDDVTSDVENHFAELNRRLYNSVDDHENLQFISKEVNNKIDQSCIEDVMRITP